MKPPNWLILSVFAGSMALVWVGTHGHPTWWGSGLAWVWGLLSLGTGLFGLPQAWMAARAEMEPPASSPPVEVETLASPQRIQEIAARFGYRDRNGTHVHLRGRWSILCIQSSWIAFGVCLLALGAHWSSDFKLRVAVEEKTRMVYADGGLELESSAWDPIRQDAVLRLRPIGGLEEQLRLKRGHGRFWRGWSLHVIGPGPESGHEADLRIRDSATDRIRDFPSVLRGVQEDLEDYRFRILKFQTATPEQGASVQLEYQEGKKAAEQFWIFEEFPDYDSVHRKSSRAYFELRSIRPHQTVEVVLARVWGAWIACLTGILGGLLLLLGLVWPRRERWLRGHAVGFAVQGHSAYPEWDIDDLIGEAMGLKRRIDPPAAPKRPLKKNSKPKKSRGKKK